MNKAIIFTSVLLLVFACKKHRLIEEKSILVGMWNWTHTIDKAIDDTIWASDVNTSYSLEFMKKGKLKFIEDEVLIDKKRVVFFKFYINNSQLPISNAYHFGISLDNNSDDNLNGFVNQDTLVVLSNFPYEQCKHCTNHLYYNYFIRN